MSNNPGISEVVDKDGVIADIEAKRFDSTRTFSLQGDVSGTQTWNGDSSTALTINASIGAKKVTQDKIGDKAVGSGQMDDGSVGFDQIDPNVYTNTVEENNTKLVTSGGVNSAIQNAVLNRGRDYGPKTVDEINALSNIPTGSTVHVSALGSGDARVVNDGWKDGQHVSIQVRVGEDLTYYISGNDHGWYSNDGDFKLKQQEYSASGLGALKTIISLSQDENGVITAVASNIQSASTSQAGVVQLNDTTNSTSTTQAATANSVKSAYDLANTANTGLANKLDNTGDGKDVTVSFTEASSMANIGTGEKLSVMFGKIKKWFSDLGTAAFKNVPASGNASSTEVVLGSDTRLSAGASAVQDVTVDGTSVVNSSKVAVVPNASTSAKGAVQLASSIGATVASENNKAATEKAVRDAINALDVSNITGFGAGKTLATLTETDGKVAATFQDIEITKSQVSDFPTEMTPSSHTHGNITNDGKIGTTAGLGIVTVTGGTVTAKDFTQASPATGSGTTTEFISTVAQGSDGAISASKQAITPASTSAAGIVQLSSSTSSSSETMAATPKAVSDLAASLGADKADKVSGATSGNFAGLDSNGNLTDSGKKASDFATAAQGSKADTAIQGVKVNGKELTKDSLNKVGITAVTGVKGSSESTYRTGQVSITAGNVGAYTTAEVDEALALKEDAANKKQTLNASSTTEFPSSAAVATFVNSSIATATANFLGNYMLIDLGLTYPATNAQIEGALETHTWPAGVTPTNNDYVIVSISSTTDPATGEPIIDEYRRFKYNDGESSWAYEYTLNNSSFTSAQWGAINSGITAGDKSAYDDHLADTGNPHSVTADQVGLGNVDNTADIDKPISTATQAALDDKVDKVYTATENHIAVFDNAGNIKDSGKTYSDMQGEFKRKQTAKSSPTASGNALSFIDTVSQDAEGVITATKKSVTVDSTYSSSGTNPVNGKAIKAAIDGLDAAITSNDGTNVQVKVTETNGKISAVNITSDNTENRNNKVSSWQTTPDNAHYPTEKLVKDSLDGKASSTHTHGNITNDGKIGSTANLVVVTGTSGVVTTADLTTASPTVPTGGTSTSLEFIDTVAQDSKGKISATKKAVPVDSTYSSTGTNPVNGKAIAAAINALDVSNISGFGAGKTLATLKEENGKISATFQDISITKSQVSDFSHAHGNIQNGGTLQTTDVAIAKGDKLVVTDASDSNKVARASLTFDGATTDQMLSKKGEWNDTIAKARAVVDYGSPSKAIEIGWGGDSVTSTESFAVYTDSANGYNKAIKDCNLKNVRKLINGTSVGSAAVPVFINANGETQVCTDDFVHDGDVTSTYSSTGAAPVNGTAVAEALKGKADKASSGNGMLAVIDSNGNYGSSGITAYNQSQINGLFSGKVIPSLQKRSQIDEQIYEFICNGQTVGKSVKFTDEYSGEDRLNFGLEFASDGTVLQFYLPINNFEENKWIWDGQTPGGSPVGLVELYAGCIKNTSGNIVPFSAHSSHEIDAYNGSSVVSARHFGGINVGSTTRQNDSYSKVNMVMKITNVITGKYVVVTFDLGVTSFANGSANQAYAIGVARCNSYGFSS